MTQPVRRRLDTEMVRRGLSVSRARAQELVSEGSVLVGGAVATKASRLVHQGESVSVSAPPPRYVSRGGVKLEAALDRFALDAKGMRAFDAGLSTGGFTDCLLQRGASSVMAVDVGYGQVHEKLRTDRRVEIRERVNIRHLESGLGPFDLVVADLSFISLTKVAPVLVELARPNGLLVVLVKPQFEAGRADVSKGRGVIRDPDLWHRAVADVALSFQRCGAAIMGSMVSPLTGHDGNSEFFLSLVAPDGVGHGGRSSLGPSMSPEEAARGAVADAEGRESVRSGSPHTTGSAGPKLDEESDQWQ
ncbi:MAG: TlyA family RNA methyltransferase [Acidimicrobiales bacterium]